MHSVSCRSRVKTSFSKMSPHPDWLSDLRLAQIYSNHSPPVRSVELIQCAPVVGLGDNYMSDLRRITVKVTTEDGSTRSESLIVKCVEFAMSLMKDYGIFHNESEMYGSVLKALEGYFLEKGEEVQFGPRCLLSTSHPSEIIVLQDLKEEGYFMEDRFQKLTLDHTKLTLSKLAKFHAAGHLYKIRGPPSNVIQRRFFAKIFSEIMARNMQRNVSALQKKMKEMEIDHHYLEQTDKWLKNLLPTNILVNDPDLYPDDFHTLVHGDLWMNNVMFKYDDQKELLDVKFVDFQMVCYGNPMFDFVYFIFSSLKPELIVEHFDELLQFYHRELIGALTVLEILTGIPTLDQLKNPLKRAGKLVGFLLITFLPMFTSGHIDITDAEPEFVSNLRYHKMDNPRFEDILRKLLPFWDENGFLDCEVTKEDLPEELKHIY